jgi:hypothetical protein
MDALTKFETETYPRIMQSAYAFGVEAKRQRLPRICNLQGSPFCSQSGHILKVYLSAWEQGWDDTI